MRLASANAPDEGDCLLRTRSSSPISAFSACPYSAPRCRLGCLQRLPPVHTILRGGRLTLSPRHSATKTQRKRAALHVHC